MDIKGFPALIVGVVVALVLAGAVLPVFAETTSAEATFTNDGLIRMEKITNEDNLTATWSYSDPYALNVNGVRIILPNSASIALTVVGSIDIILRYTPGTGGTSTQMIGFIGNSTIQASTDNQRDITITISEGNISVTNGVTSASAVFEYAFIVSNDGAYTMKNPNDSVYILTDSEIYGFGRTWLPSSSVTVNFNIVGSTEGVIVSSFGTVEATASNININYSVIDSYIDLVNFNSITFDATVTGTDSVTYNQVIVPYEVTAEKTIHPDATLSTLLNILPLLAIAGLVTGAVVWFVSRKG